MSKTFTVSMMRNTRATCSEGIKWGRVMERKRCHPFAPSMVAASIWLSGSVCSAASAIMATREKFFQMSANITDHSALSAVPIQLTY